MSETKSETQDQTQDQTGLTETLVGGSIEISVEPVQDAQVLICVKHGGTLIERSEYPRDVFTARTPKGTFLNTVEDALDARPGIDASDARQEINQWLTEFGEVIEEEEEALLPAAARDIVDGTEYPVEVYAGDPATWHVTITYAGRRGEIEFTPGEMVSSGSGALEEKIANKFFEIVEIDPDDWEIIRDRWNQNKVVIDVGNLNPGDVIAERTLGYLKHAVIPVGDKDLLRNDPQAAWYDAGNSAGYDGVDPDTDILWIQGECLGDQYESAGKKVETLGQLAKDLIRRGDMYGPSVRRRWGGERRKFYPFDPERVGIKRSDVAETEPATSEVEA